MPVLDEEAELDTDEVEDTGFEVDELEAEELEVVEPENRLDDPVDNVDVKSIASVDTALAALWKLTTDCTELIKLDSGTVVSVLPPALTFAPPLDEFPNRAVESGRIVADPGIVTGAVDCATRLVDVNAAALAGTDDIVSVVVG